MDFQDKVIVCEDCGKEFTFSAGEQEHYEQLGFQNEPKRCAPCRVEKKKSRGEMGRPAQGGGPKQMFEAVCSDCGGAASVPFKPRGDRPVYCSNCFDKHKTRA